MRFALFPCPAKLRVRGRRPFFPPLLGGGEEEEGTLLSLPIPHFRISMLQNGFPPPLPLQPSPQSPPPPPPPPPGLSRLSFAMSISGPMTAQPGLLFFPQEGAVFSLLPFGTQTMIGKLGLVSPSPQKQKPCIKLFLFFFRPEV